jgi:hypothetical protein
MARPNASSGVPTHREVSHAMPAPSTIAAMVASR